ncbi:MAG: DUF3494 domain-containing protein [Coriobacteriia bacterium]|nr:DUF3494 domain-containing protein [Coriobacteriia bacterium]
MREQHVLPLVTLLALLLPMSAHAACVNLGTAGDFALLGGSGVTNAVSGTVVQGDVGSSPTPAVTGFPPGVVVGTLYTAPDPATAQAQSDLAIAYNAAAGQACDTDMSATPDLGGQTLVAGVYCFSSEAGLTGTLTLDAQGDPNACWVFQIGSTLITATNSNVLLINGASACNVFWQVGSSATIASGSDFVGSIMALTSITLDGGTLQGRALARNGAVTISGSEFVNSICIPSHPCVSVLKDANRPSAAIGDTIVYTYTICNCGPTTITVDSVIDVPLGDLTGTFTAENGGATLAVGACTVFTVNHLVTGADADPLTNTVTVNVHDTTGTATDEATTSVDIVPATPTVCVDIVKVADRIVASVDDVVTYTYTICNCGTTTLTVDSVTDDLLGDLTAAFIADNGGTDLLAGACQSFTATHTVLISDTSPIENIVTVNAHNGATPVEASDNWTITIVPGPCVSIAKVADSPTASAGGTITYTFTVCNCGTLPVTVDSVIDSHLGDLTAAFLAANGGSPIIPFGECVVFTASYLVLPTDPAVITNSVTVTAHVDAEVVTDTAEETVLIVPQLLYQAVLTPGGVNTAYQGYSGAGDDVISSMAGVFSIVPGINWANFVSAAQMGVDYSLKNVVLCKTHPDIIQCADVFPSGTICQQGTPNIRLWWPLMYEVPGTTWRLTIVYGTNVLFDDDGPGPHRPAYVHTETWTWQVDATIASIKDVLELFHELPFGLDEVPLVSDEWLYPVLQAKLDAIAAALAANPPDLLAAGLILGDFEMEVMDACIGSSPARPNPTGPGTGIAASLENPACCKLMADAEYVGFQLGILQPSK